MDRYRYVILGGGMVAGHAAQEMVKQGLEPGELCIVSMDEDPPYERPLTSPPEIGPPAVRGFLVE